MNVKENPKVMECFYIHAYQREFIEEYSKRKHITHGKIVRDALDTYMKKLGIIDDTPLDSEHLEISGAVLEKMMENEEDNE